MSTSTIVGALACQKNSFLKSFTTRVIASSEIVPPPTSKDKQTQNNERRKEFAVELEDTILFPEGGGQPFDQGTIILPDNKTIQVKSVLRENLRAIHLVDELIGPGTKVDLKLNWSRRIDIMQQHTGQHLLSAVFDTYDLETLSWSMGESELNYIELPKKIDDTIISQVQDKVDELIIENLPIKVVTPEDHGEEIDTSHIPDDYDTSKGIIRIVKIGDLDANPCCGTHLQTTGQIQSIVLLHQSPIRGGHSRLYFTCGSRVSKYLKKQNDFLKNAGAQLSCAIEDVCDKIELLNANYKKSISTNNNLLKELANIEAKKLVETFKSKDAAYVYRDDASDYLSIVQKELSTLINSNKEDIDLKSKHTLILLNNSMIKVLGPKSEEIQKEMKQRITNLKGGGKGTSFQGKILKFEKGELKNVLLYLDSL
ncbi:unnamed protein product [Candida verbasci]|uniref:Alanyl-transfer RNA synthetases family profile domain-containing protein n=1 Tax=Candida verbasci TaxID=1227364 RepID=A0A9W4TVM7_9ASCO|nr:unnamed protein product [Candida verbasci]